MIIVRAIISLKMIVILNEIIILRTVCFNGLDVCWGYSCGMWRDDEICIESCNAGRGKQAKGNTRFFSKRPRFCTSSYEITGKANRIVFLFLCSFFGSIKGFFKG